MNTQQFLEKLDRLQNKGQSIRHFVWTARAGSRSLKDHSTVKTYLQILEAVERLESLQKEYFGRIKSRKYRLAVDDPLGVKFEAVNRLLRQLQPVLQGKVRGSSALRDVSKFWSDLQAFEEKYNRAVEGQSSRLSKVVNQLATIVRMDADRSLQIEKINQLLTNAAALDNQPAVLIKLAHEHPELVEYLLTQPNGLSCLQRLADENPDVINHVMPVVQHFRLPLIQDLLRKSINANLTIAGPLLHAAVNAVGALPQAFRKKHDVEKLCQGCLSDSFAQMNEAAPFAVLDAVHQLPTDWQAQLFISNGELVYPTSTRHIYSHLRTSVFIKLYALMQEPVLESVYSAIRFTPDELEDPECRLYSTLLQAYDQLNKASLSGESEVIALGIKEHIYEIISGYVRSDQQAVATARGSLLDYLQNHDLAGTVLPNLAELQTLLQQVEAQAAAEAAEAAEAAAAEAEAGAAADNPALERLDTIAEVEEDDFSDFDSEAGSDVSEDSLDLTEEAEAGGGGAAAVDAVDEDGRKHFDDYSYYKRYMQMDFLELSLPDKIDFLTTATYARVSVLRGQDIALDDETRAALHHEEAAPQMQARKSALYYISDANLFAIREELKSKRGLSEQELELLRGVDAELEQRPLTTYLQKLKDLVEITRPSAGERVRAVAVGAMELDDRGRNRPQVLVECRAVRDSLHGYFQALLREYLSQLTDANPAIFFAIPVDMLQAIFSNGLVQADFVDLCTEIGSGSVFDQESDVVVLEDHSHLESAEKRLMVLQLMIRYFHAEETTGPLKTLMRFIEKSGLSKGEKLHLRRFAQLVGVGQEARKLWSHYDSQQTVGVVNHWKQAVCDAIINRVESVVGNPVNDAALPEPLQADWEKQVKTLLAVISHRGRLEKKSAQGEFIHKLRNLLQRLKGCVETTPFEMSKTVLADELAGHEHRKDLYNAYLFSYVWDNAAYLLEIKSAAGAVEGNLLLGDFGRSVLSGIAKHDIPASTEDAPSLLPDFFRAISTLHESHPGLDLNYLIESIVLAFEEADDRLGKNNFSVDLQYLHTDIRRQLLMAEKDDGTRFLAYPDIYRYVDFEDCVACIQQVAVTEYDSREKVLEAVQAIQAISQCWENKYYYWKNKYDESVADSWDTPVTPPAEVIDFVEMAATAVMEIGFESDVPELMQKISAIIEAAVANKGMPVTALLDLAAYLDLPASDLEEALVSKLKGFFGLDKLLTDQRFIRHLYASEETIPLPDLWRLHHHLALNNGAGRYRYDMIREDAVDGGFICDTLFDQADAREDEESLGYNHLGVLVASYHRIKGLRSDYDGKLEKITRDAKKPNYKETKAIADKKQMFQAKQLVCQDLEAILAPLKTSEYADLAQAHAYLEGALLPSLKDYFDNPNNAGKLKWAEKGNHSELKRKLHKLSQLCGAECAYRGSKEYPSIFRASPGGGGAAAADESKTSGPDAAGGGGGGGGGAPRS